MCDLSEIVISGSSLRLPESGNMEELARNLYGGLDLVTDDDRRWPGGLYGLPNRTGKLKELDKFDPGAFGLDAEKANSMDPQLRILLELTTESLLDAGVNPSEIRGSNTGVFVGISKDESQEIFSNDSDRIGPYFLEGYTRAMVANGLSSAFDFKGPSITVDTACSSSLLALERAVASMRSGSCNSAIVAGVNILLTPTYSLGFNRLNMLSSEGKCKAFDESGKGYVRSEAAVVLFLQRGSCCKRAYATLIHAKTNSDGYKEQGITYPSGEDQRVLLVDVYSEAGINPKDVTYVEAHGTGTKVGDPEEVNAIASVFCPKDEPRKNPLLIGSIKSNMGHSEPASGLSSIAKIILAFQNKIIPGNLHFSNPNPNIPGLLDGSLKVVSENTEWEPGLVGINSFGFGGANVHVILAPPICLNGRIKVKSHANSDHDSNLPNGNGHTNAQSKIPAILPMSGRDGDSLAETLKSMTYPDPEFTALLHSIHKSRIPQHDFRGFAITSPEGEIKGSSNWVQPLPKEPRELWFIFSGMGTQWAGMGKDLLIFEPFRKSIGISERILSKTGFNLMEKLMSDHDDIYENFLNSFVCIAAIQIALTDLLTEVGLKPDGIVGHSVGENAAAYSDECSSHFNTLMGAYWAGKTFQESTLPPGGMAAVGLTWEEAKRRCPPDIYPACNNAPDSVSISGPVGTLKTFVDQLKSEGIFAKYIPSGQAFHSPYISSLKPALMESLIRNGIASEPKVRSDRWKSTSIPTCDWGNQELRKFTADYWANNLISPVLFQEAIAHIPPNAVVVEVAPHSLLQAVLKRSLPSSCTIIGTSSRASPNNAITLLNCIGRIYCDGYQPDFSKLYPPVEFPVTLGTPMLSHLTNWDHSESFSVATFDHNFGICRERIIEIDLKTDQDEYLFRHRIDGRVVFPPSGYLTLVWRLFSKMRGDIPLEEFPISFEGVKFHEIVHLTNLRNDTQPIKLLLNILDGSGKFEVTSDSREVICSGMIREFDPDSEQAYEVKGSSLDKPKYLPMDTSDVYHELELRGYGYGGVFRGIKMADNEGKWGCLTWDENWTSFLDSLMQFRLLSLENSGLALPKFIQKLTINPKALINTSDPSESIPDGHLMPFKGIIVRHLAELDIIRAKGVEIRGMSFQEIPRTSARAASSLVEEYQFTPYFDDPDEDWGEVSLEDSLGICMDLIMENLNPQPLQGLKFLEVNSDLENSPIALEVRRMIRNKCWQEEGILLSNADAQSIEEFPKKGVKVISMSKVKELSTILGQNELHLAILQDISQFEIVEPLLSDSGFILIQSNGPTPSKGTNNSHKKLHLISHKRSSSGYFNLYRKKRNFETEGKERRPDLIKINVQSGNFDWVKTLTKIATSPRSNSPYIYLISSNPPNAEILGLVNCLKREQGCENIRCVFSAEDSHSSNPTSNGTSILSRRISISDYANGHDPPPPTSTVSITPGKSSMQKIIDNEMGINVFIKDKVKGEIWGTYRRVTSFQDRLITSSGCAQVSQSRSGDLSSLSWIESPVSDANTSCKIYYSALSFRDVLIASGKLEPGVIPHLGMEFSGKLEADNRNNNRRVMGLVQGGALTTNLVPNRDFLWQIPTSWTLEDAATIPLAYSTAYYALIIRGDLRPGQSILIHSGSGGVGQAGIAIALHMKCTVFTTVSSEKKKAILLNLFPELNPNHIANSRNSDFEQIILEETDGRGVDVVLNVLSNHMMAASIRCLAIHGRFLELGRTDLFQNAPLGMAIFLKNITFHGVIFELLFDEPEGGGDRKRLYELMTQGIKDGVVKPLPRTVFGSQVEELERGFRYLASGETVGKVLFRIREEDSAPAIDKSLKAIGITRFDPDKAYVIICGLCKFGLQLSSWLIQRGARSLFIVTRTGVTSGYQDLCMRRWRRQSAQVEMVRTDVTTLNGALRMIQHVLKTSSIGGIFNLAMGMKDFASLNQSADHFMAASSQMIKSTQFLDIASRKLCPSLDYFVIFSNVSNAESIDELSATSNPYGLVNLSLQRICERRTQNGLPALAVQWGSIVECEITGEVRNVAVVGSSSHGGIRVSYNTLDYFLRTSQRETKQPSSIIPKIPQGVDTSTSLIDKLINTLGSRDEDLSLADLGVDSLFALELKTYIEKERGLEMTPREVSSHTLSELRQILAENGFK